MEKHKMAKAIKMTKADRFTLGFYYQAVTKTLTAPGEFFDELPKEVGFRLPLGFLILSSLFFVGASLTQVHERPILMAGILLINAMGMPLISAGISFMVMIMVVGKRESFARVLAVYAFAAGVTMLASWIPLFVWLTEPWKWLLIAIGMVKGCGLGWMQAIVVVGLTIVIVVLFFWSLGPLIVYFRGLTG
jgi:hypothetical protein